MIEWNKGEPKGYWNPDVPMPSLKDITEKDVYGQEHCFGKRSGVVTITSYATPDEQKSVLWRIKAKPVHTLTNQIDWFFAYLKGRGLKIIAITEKP